MQQLYFNKAIKKLNEKGYRTLMLSYFWKKESQALDISTLALVFSSTEVVFSAFNTLIYIPVLRSTAISSHGIGLQKHQRQVIFQKSNWKFISIPNKY